MPKLITGNNLKLKLTLKKVHLNSNIKKELIKLAKEHRKITKNIANSKYQ